MYRDAICRPGGKPISHFLGCFDHSVQQQGTGCRLTWLSLPLNASSDLKKGIESLAHSTQRNSKDSQALQIPNN